MRYSFLLFPVVAPVVNMMDVTQQRTAGIFPLILKIHLSGFLLLKFFCNCRLRDKYIFLPEVVQSSQYQSSQYFSQFLSAHQTEQGRKQTFCPPFLTGCRGELGPRFKSSKCCNWLMWWKNGAKCRNYTIFAPLNGLNNPKWKNKRKREKQREKSSFSAAGRSYDLFIFCRLRWTA